MSSWLEKRGCFWGVTKHIALEMDHVPKIIFFSSLQKWLEVSSRRRSGPPCCELCQYQYLRHKKFVVSLQSRITSTLQIFTATSI